MYLTIFRSFFTNKYVIMGMLIFSVLTTFTYLNHKINSKEQKIVELKERLSDTTKQNKYLNSVIEQNKNLIVDIQIRHNEELENIKKEYENMINTEKVISKEQEISVKKSKGKTIKETLDYLKELEND